jgi:hypothetical protein
MRARWLTPFLLLGLAIDGFAAQDWVGTGSNLSSCQKLYEGLDPQLGLKWHPEIMPPTSLGRCVGDKDWKLLGQEGGSCCFLAPSTQGPEPAFLVPIDKISTNGGRCGQHPWAPTFAICTEPPGPQQRPQATGNRPNNPCWIDDSLPPKQRVELYQRCVGQTPTPIEGARSIERRPDQSLKPTKVSPPNDAAAMIDAMDRCLRAQPLIYYHSPNKRTYSGVAASDHSTILYNPAYLNRQPPYLRA